MYRALLLCLALTVAPALGADEWRAVDPAQDVELKTSVDATGQSGKAEATIRIAAPPEVIWPLLVNCAEALTLVPGLVGCEVLETAPDRSWQLMRQVVDYSWVVRKMTYDVRATYDEPLHLSITRVAGDLRRLDVTWQLQRDGSATVARYEVEFSPAFWVPNWLIRIALKRDLPKMLRAVRQRAESRAHAAAGVCTDGLKSSSECSRHSP